MTKLYFMNYFILKLKNQKLFFTLFVIIIVVSFNNCKPEKVDLCDKYKEYFEGKGSDYTKEDSVNVLKYAQKLTELYSKNKDVYARIAPCRHNSNRFEPLSPFFQTAGHIYLIFP